jgi:hypothetical protein
MEKSNGQKMSKGGRRRVEWPAFPQTDENYTPSSFNNSPEKIGDA